MPRKRLQMCSTRETSERPFSQFLTPTHFLFLSSLIVFLSHKHTYTQTIFCSLSREETVEEKLMGSAPSFTCLVISGDEGHGQNPPQLFCL